MRYTTHGNVLYAIVLAPPTQDVRLAELASGKELPAATIKSVEQLGGGAVPFERTNVGLRVTPKPTPANDKTPVVFKIVCE